MERNLKNWRVKMANYWIKLYHELLDDPKTATLPDRLWRRFIECCLLAGRFGKNGALPDTTQLAWVLRMNTDDLAHDLDQLTATGMIQRTTGGWLVVNFSKRQAAVGDAERKSQSRKRDQTEQYYGHENVTNQSRSVTQITDTDIDTESESDIETESDTEQKRLFSEICKAYESEIGALTPIIADELESALKDYPPDWFLKAFQESAKNNARSWKYALAILRRWKVDGVSIKSNGRGKRVLTDADGNKVEVDA